MDKKKEIIPDILVYATPFEVSDNNWGYKWIGFYNNKRFSVIQKSNDGNVYIDEQHGEYIFEENEQVRLLPEKLCKLIHRNPLPNKYFSLRVAKEESFEIIMKLIENGYDIENDIICLCSKEYPYQVCDKNNRIIAEITVEGRVVWHSIKEEKEDMEDKIYLELYKKLIRLYKDEIDVGISFEHKSKQKFKCSTSVKIADLELEDDYMYIEAENGEMYIYKENKISHFVRGERVYSDKYVIDFDEFKVVIDTEDIY